MANLLLTCQERLQQIWQSHREQVACPVHVRSKPNQLALGNPNVWLSGPSRVRLGGTRYSTTNANWSEEPNMGVRHSVYESCSVGHGDPGKPTKHVQQRANPGHSICPWWKRRLRPGSGRNQRSPTDKRWVNLSVLAEMSSGPAPHLKVFGIACSSFGRCHVTTKHNRVASSLKCLATVKNRCRAMWNPGWRGA